MTPAAKSCIAYNTGYAAGRAGEPLQEGKSRGYELGHAQGVKHAAAGLQDPAVADEIRHVLYLFDTEDKEGAQGYLAVVGQRRGKKAEDELRRLALDALAKRDANYQPLPANSRAEARPAEPYSSSTTRARETRRG